jgi:hypothetical protein
MMDGCRWMGMCIGGLLTCMENGLVEVSIVNAAKGVLARYVDVCVCVCWYWNPRFDHENRYTTHALTLPIYA